MSYVYVVSPKAQAILATLDVELQERTYDELDHLAAHPWLVQPRKPGEAAICDFIFDRPDGRHYVFVTVERNDAARSLIITMIASYLKPAGQP